MSWITPQQARLYFKYLDSLGSQEIAAVKAGISVRSAQRIEANPEKYLMPAPKKRDYRTRPDPFIDSWETEILPLLNDNPGLKAITVLRFLQESHPGAYPDRLLRTLQRKVRGWRALSGPEKEVYFPQKKEIGRFAIVDFTDANELGVTIGGLLLEHRLFHFRLPFSGWHWSTLVLGGESYTALGEGLETALEMLGGVPRQLRTDSLSAAWKNKAEKDEMTRLFEQLCEHYNLEPQHNNPGKGHENGWIESIHGHFKSQLKQHLMLRGSSDFDSFDEYRAWVRKIHSDNNRRLGARLEEERATLKPLPATRAVTWKPVSVSVSTYDTISVDRVLYTVPSRLKGFRLNVHLFDDRLELFLPNGTFVEKLERKRTNDRNRRVRNINYRHVIHSLVKKPGALPGLTYLDDLHPGPAWRRTWMALRETLPERQASREYVGLLHIAHTRNCEEPMTLQLEKDLYESKLPRLENYRESFIDQPEASIQGPEVNEVQPSDFDHLLNQHEKGKIS